MDNKVEQKGLAGADNMRILRFEAEHIKKIQVVRITPSGHVFEVSGKNGAGKTSILDSIWWALAGTRSHQPDPIQHGHDKGRIKLDLGVITVEREFKRQKAAPGKQDERITTRLIVKTAKGLVMQSPQSILDQLLGALSFDPLAFARKSAVEQYQALQQACGVDLQSIDRLNEEDYLARTIANRTAKEKRAAADNISVPAQVPERIDVAALVAERKRREKLNGARGHAIARRESLERQVEAVEQDKSRVVADSAAAKMATERFDDEQAAALNRFRAEQAEESLARVSMLGRYGEQIAGCKASLGALPEPPAQEVFSDIDEQIEQAGTVNAAAHEAERQSRDLGRLEREYEDAEDESIKLTEAMEGRKRDAAKAVEKAALPIPGLSLDNGQVSLDSVPFGQASDADQLRASCAIAMRDNAKLRVLRIRDGSLLDDDSMQILADMATAADFQIWVERVIPSGQDGITIEDGRVKEG